MIEAIRFDDILPSEVSRMVLAAVGCDVRYGKRDFGNGILLDTISIYDNTGENIDWMDPYESLDACYICEGYLDDTQRYMYAGYLRGMITKRYPPGTDYAVIEWAITHCSSQDRCRALLGMKGIAE